MRQSMHIAQRARLLGASMDMVTAGQVLDFVADAAQRGGKAIVANHNLHSLHLVRTDRDMAAMYERADLIAIDSMPLVLWGRLTHGFCLTLKRSDGCTASFATGGPGGGPPASWARQRAAPPMRGSSGGPVGKALVTL